MSGLWGKPTIVQNVETLCNLPHIVSNGSDWFQGLEPSEDGGTKLYGVSGKVKRPGLWELPMGTPCAKFSRSTPAACATGFNFAALLPGGASTDFLVEEHLDTPMDLRKFRKPAAEWEPERWWCWTIRPVRSAWSGIWSISSRRNRAAGARRAGAGSAWTEKILLRNGAGPRRAARSGDA